MGSASLDSHAKMSVPGAVSERWSVRHDNGDNPGQGASSFQDQ